MGESPAGDIQDLWVEYQTSKGLLITLQAQLALVQGVASGVIDVAPGSANDDYMSFARSGPKGSTSWNRESLLSRQRELVDQIKEMFDTMREQRRLAIMATPGFGRRRVSQGPRFRGF